MGLGVVDDRNNLDTHNGSFSISGTKPAPYLQIVFLVRFESRAEHVPHDNQIVFGAAESETVHSEIVRQQCFTLILHYVLQESA